MIAGGVTAAFGVPPLGIPSSIQFKSIDLDSSAEAEGGGLTTPQQIQVTAHIEGDDSQFFSVSGIETLRIVFRDPEVPHSKPTWETLDSVDGAGPISMAGAKALGVTVQFTSPKQPPKTSFSGTAVVVPQDGRSPGIMRIPIQATVGEARIKMLELGFPGGGILPGQTVTDEFELSSTINRDVSGTLECITDPESPFSGTAVNVTVPAFGFARASVNVTCAPGTPPTTSTILPSAVFAFRSSDPAANASETVSLKVLTPRTVSLSTSLPQNLLLLPNSSTICKITGTDSGGLDDITMSAATVPQGISVNIGQVSEQGNPIVPDPNAARSVEVDVTITVSGQAFPNPAPSPLVLSWSAPADDRHPAVSGTIQFNCRVADTGQVLAKIKDFHRRTGADYGPLGVLIGDVVNSDGTATQNTQLGQITLADNPNAEPQGQVQYAGLVTLSAVRCFGTQDKDGSDSTYAVISLISVDPNNAGSDELVKTTRTEIVDNVHAGTTLFKMRPLGPAVSLTGAGLLVHVALWDHESGNADDIKNQIESALEDGVKQGATALAAAASADDPSVSAGTIGKITDFEVAGIKPFRVLTLGIAGLIANALADDLIGEQSFFIPAANIREWADDQSKFNASVRKDPDLPFDVELNWPPTFDDEKDFIFTDGQGTYKVYFLIRGVKQTINTIPALK
jgi:hypothetical protein